MALVRFLTDYRSRAWSSRFYPDAVVDIENVALLGEVLEAGVAELVVPPVPVDEVEPVPEEESGSDDDEAA